MVNFAFGLGIGYVLGIYVQYYVIKLSKDLENDGK
jgi:hypothetical protein